MSTTRSSDGPERAAARATAPITSIFVSFAVRTSSSGPTASGLCAVASASAADCAARKSPDRSAYFPQRKSIAFLFPILASASNAYFE